MATHENNENEEEAAEEDQEELENDILSHSNHYGEQEEADGIIISEVSYTI